MARGLYVLKLTAVNYLHAEPDGPKSVHNTFYINIILIFISYWDNSFICIRFLEKSISYRSFFHEVAHAKGSRKKVLSLEVRPLYQPTT